MQWTAELPQAVTDADVVVLWWANTGVGFAWHGEEYLTCDAPETVGGRFDEMIDLLAQLRESALVLFRARGAPRRPALHHARRRGRRSGAVRAAG